MEQIRTCVACRRRDSRAVLMRVVLADGALVVDDRRALPGRGAWVHESAQCLGLAVSRGVFSRALRASGSLDVSPLENRLKSLMEK